MMAWLLIASSRLQLFSMLLLPLTAGILLRRYWYVVITLVGVACVIAWQLLMMQTVVDGRVTLGASTASIAAYYLQNPDQLFKVLSDTLTDGDRLRGYFSSFFGLLGWLDTPFAGKEYTYLLVLILLIFVCSISHRSLFQNKLIRTVLITCGLGSLAIIFFAMLVSWTPHPAKLIDGVQGRYFLIPAILFSYACCDRMATQSSVRKVLVFGLTASLGAYSLINTILLVFSRYY
jgi:uncharacterized membrane protein